MTFRNLLSGYVLLFRLRRLPNEILNIYRPKGEISVAVRVSCCKIRDINVNSSRRERGTNIYLQLNIHTSHDITHNINLMLFAQ